MAKQVISIGTSANSGTGDPLRTAFTKANENFTEVYDALAGIEEDIANIDLGNPFLNADNLLEVVETTEITGETYLYVLVKQPDNSFLPRRLKVQVEEGAGETFYFTDDVGNILTDDAGNRFIWT